MISKMRSSIGACGKKSTQDERRSKSSKLSTQVSMDERS